MVASYAGIVVFTIIALIFPLTPLLAARFVRAQPPAPSTTPARRRGLAAILEPGTPTAERFLTTLVWTVVGIQFLVLLSWVVAFNAVTLFSLVELGIALVVLVVGLTYAWRKGILARRRSAAILTEPTE